MSELIVLSEKQKQGIDTAFATKDEEKSILLKMYDSILSKEITEEIAKEAKSIRNKLVKVRTGAVAIHATQKATALAYGRYCDALKNQYILPVVQAEEKLLEIEKYFENQEKERIAKLQEERATKLSVYVQDADIKDLTKFDNDEFEAVLLMKKNAYLERIRAEKEAEAQRVAEQKAIEKKEQARKAAEEKIRAENEILRAEAEEAKRKEAERIEAERVEIARIEKERAERGKRLDHIGEGRREQLFQIGVSADFVFCRDMSESEWNDFYNKEVDKYQTERARLEEIEKQKQEKERAENERIQKELEEKQRIEKELKDKKDQEEKAKKEAYEKEQTELRKGDSDKVADLINDLEALKTKYSFDSEVNRKKYTDTGVLIEKVINYIKK